MGDCFEFKINGNSAQTAMSQQEMVDWYNSIDVFLTTGCAEGGPSPPIEAMSCGRSVIGTESGYLGEVVDNFSDGLLFTPYSCESTAKEKVDAIKSALETLDKDMLSVSGDNARKKIENKYSWSVVAEDWIKAIAGPSEEQNDPR
jgi:glycosyltransferase involved in cell wall biosynthesis